MPRPQPHYPESRPPTLAQSIQLNVMNDMDLVQAFLQGRNAAFEEITRRHYKQLWCGARRLSRSDQDADDIMQETMLKAIANLPRYRGEASLKTWLWKLLRTTAYDHNLRRPGLPTTSIEELNHEANISTDPLHHMASTMSISAALDQLPPGQRDAIILVDLMGFDVEKAADRLGVQPGTVKSRRARGRDTLKKLLFMGNDLTVGTELGMNAAGPEL